MTTARNRFRPVPAELLQQIVEGTASETGEAFFRLLVKNLSQALGTYGAWVTDYLPEARRLRARAFWIGGRFVEHYEYDIAGTPCEPVIDRCRLLHIPERVIELFPSDPDLQTFGAVSYTGMPFTDERGRILGHLAVLDIKPLQDTSDYLAVFRIFAARAAAELRRLRAEVTLREREARLARLIRGALDGIVDVDAGLRIRLINPAAAKALGLSPREAVGRQLDAYLSEASARKLAGLIAPLDPGSKSGRRSWIAGGLQARRSNGESFEIEATLSQTHDAEPSRYTLIFRDVNERLEAERRIRKLEQQARYLEAELRALEGGGQLIGRSEAMREALAALAQVAATDATVLLLGESGTGKELFARALHEQSSRLKAPLIKVNCAAIPGELVESELFGHEKGAFTGATSKREGRFALAHGGTIFLDEIGDLPLALQAKLLRVLQEGEFEPVGSSTTRKVDVRVIAATHRDLAALVERGGFRQDLYYRLNVFPLQIPPLRERGDDVILLAETFARSFARRFGRDIAPLSRADLARLRDYSWPGNVRELQNVIERAVITATDGHLDLRRILQPMAPGSGATAPAIAEVPIRTETEMREIERANIRRALDACAWKVAGDRGAAQLLGVSPSTLASRIKSLGIRRPTV
jgi:PAS domain S-box-containing protein